MTARPTDDPLGPDDQALEAVRSVLPEPDEDDLVEDRPSDEASAEDHRPLHDPWQIPI